MKGKDINFVRQQISKALQDLPALPTVVGKILTETENPNATTASIEKMISSDQVLASKVLRVVNSAYYGLSGQVTSLSQAIVILGMQQIRNLVLSVCALSQVKPTTARQHEVLKQFWLHSFGTAAAAQGLGKKKKLPLRDCDTLFIGGLLHDVGRLFIFSNFTEVYDAVLQHAIKNNCTVEEAEIELLGMSHAQIGGEMGRHWKLPEVLISLIEEHEGPFETGGSPMLYVLHYSDTITKHLYMGEDWEKMSRTDPVALSFLGLDEAGIQEVKEETEKKVEEAAGLFGLIAA